MKVVLLVVIYSSLFLFIIYKWSFFRLPIKKWLILSIFLLKVVVGICLVEFLKFYYPESQKVDLFNFFKDGKIAYQALINNPSDFLTLAVGGKETNSFFYHTYYNKMDYWLRPRKEYLLGSNHTIILFNGIVNLFSQGVVYVHVVFMSFLSFIGTIALLKFLLVKTKEKFSLTLFSLLAFFPSFLIFGSAPIKEGLVIFSVGLIIWSLHRVLTYKSIISSIIGLAACFLLMFTKFYLFCSLFIVLFIYTINFIKNKKKFNLKLYIGLMLSFFVFIILIGIAFPNFSVISIITSKQYAFEKLLTSQPVRFTTPVVPVDSYFSLIKSFFIAFKNVFVIPLNTTLATLPIVIENLLFLIGSLYFLWKFNLKSKYLSTALLFLGFGFIVSFIIGATTPILYAIYRYRAPIMPLLLISFFLLSKHAASSKKES